ncbi:15292_t:CDS:2 [Funneliformis geosporum]|nr:15292_t:CDS:2 [Funneliformis geosporum]
MPAAFKTQKANKKKIIWEDVEFDQELETFVKFLLDRMKNYMSPI